ncbi:MAG: zinc-ribbon domain-containing protein [Gammaproteobacteria bacterium]
MNCPNCGAGISGNDSFCSKCGKPAPPAKPASVEPRVAQNKVTVKPKITRNLKPIQVIAGLLFALAGVVAIAYFSSPSSSPSTPSVTQASPSATPDTDSDDVPTGNAQDPFDAIDGEWAASHGQVSSSMTKCELAAQMSGLIDIMRNRGVSEDDAKAFAARGYADDQELTAALLAVVNGVYGMPQLQPAPVVYSAFSQICQNP